MPSTTSPSATPSPDEAKLKSALEKSSVKFQIKAGNAKWACTLHDRASYEKQKATRTTSSSASVSTTDSATASK